MSERSPEASRAVAKPAPGCGSGGSKGRSGSGISRAVARSLRAARYTALVRCPASSDFARPRPRPSVSRPRAAARFGPGPAAPSLRATPWSHEPSDSGFRIDRAFRARTRNAAWAASCASWRSPSRSRQTRRTVGPCRSTSAVKAVSDNSSGPARNRSSSCASVRPPMAPTSQSVWIVSCAAVEASNDIGSDLLAVGVSSSIVTPRTRGYFRIPYRTSRFLQRSDTWRGPVSIC